MGIQWVSKGNGGQSGIVVPEGGEVPLHTPRGEERYIVREENTNPLYLVFYSPSMCPVYSRSPANGHPPDCLLHESGLYVTVEF